MKLSQGLSLTLVRGHSDFKVKCLTFGLYTQVSDSGPDGPLVFFFGHFGINGRRRTTMLYQFLGSISLLYNGVAVYLWVTVCSQIEFPTVPFHWMQATSNASNQMVHLKNILG